MTSNEKLPENIQLENHTSDWPKILHHLGGIQPWFLTVMSYSSQDRPLTNRVWLGFPNTLLLLLELRLDFHGEYEGNSSSYVGKRFVGCNLNPVIILENVLNCFNLQGFRGGW